MRRMAFVALKCFRFYFSLSIYRMHKRTSTLSTLYPCIVCLFTSSTLLKWVLRKGSKRKCFPWMSTKGRAWNEIRLKLHWNGFNRRAQPPVTKDKVFSKYSVPNNKWNNRNRTLRDDLNFRFDQQLIKTILIFCFCQIFNKFVFGFFVFSFIFFDF